MIDLRNADWEGAAVKIGEASSLTPFEYGLEYGSPARGLWNIVHTAMLLPESHQIFVCAQGCLRGVVLTAAEMGAQGRFSTVAVCENNVTDGDMERLVIDGTRDILQKLRYAPRAVFIFTSCIHDFMACDLEYIFRELRREFPCVLFTDGHMYPIMRKTKLPPDPATRRALYAFLEKSDAVEAHSVNIIGNNYPTAESADFVKTLSDGGFFIRDITKCKTFDEYLKMSRSSFNIVYMPAATAAARDLKERLGTDYIYIPLSYDENEIENSLNALSDALGLKRVSSAAAKEEAREALRRAVEVLDGASVAVDYTATPRPLGLAKLLLEAGANVEWVYADNFSKEEESAFERLKEKFPGLELRATVHPKMGILPRGALKKPEDKNKKVVAIGQKAAYFHDAKHFVNMLEGGGRWGFDGIKKLAEDICDAAEHEKDMKSIIQVKGWGCCCR